MSDWRSILSQLAGDVEQTFDRLVNDLDQRFGTEPLQIVPYDSFGTAEQLTISGRVLESQSLIQGGDRETIWNNLLNTYRRFMSDEVPDARLQAQAAGATVEVRSDAEGFFTATLQPAQPLPSTALWHPVALEILEAPSAATPVTAQGEVLVPPPGARFGVISDIDDTVVQTGATNILQLAQTLFLQSARSRLTFPGTAAFYRGLYQTAPSSAVNPVFYLSSSPWNLYDLLIDFFRFHDFPRGPLLLRDWGIGPSEDSNLLDHHHHKRQAIQRLLETYPELPFILIGDSGQQDPEIYSAVVPYFPGRILAIYIRDVVPQPERRAAIETLAETTVPYGVPLLLAEDIRIFAQHANQRGWLRDTDLDAIAQEFS